MPSALAIKKVRCLFSTPEQDQMSQLVDIMIEAAASEELLVRKKLGPFPGWWSGEPSQLPFSLVMNLVMQQPSALGRTLGHNSAISLKLFAAIAQLICHMHSFTHQKN